MWPSNGSALLRSAVSSDRDWTGRRTYLLDRLLSGGLDICYFYPTHSHVPSRLGQVARLNLTWWRPVVKREMTLSVPMIYIAHNEGRGSYIVRIICDSSSWSHRSATLLNHDGRFATCELGRLAPSSLNKPQYTPRGLTSIIVRCTASFWSLLTA